MEQSPRLSLSYIAPSQAQKHVPANESFRRLDALVQLSVISRMLAAEPATPAEGDAYILPADAAGGVWDGFAQDNIAVFQDGAWAEIFAIEGVRAWVGDEAVLAVYDGSGWVGAGPGSGGVTAAELENGSINKLGVNAGADSANRLSVRSNAVLIDAIDANEGGSGDVQIKVNKEAAGDTASHLFQTGFSGRAEFGLAGDDHFHIKVTPDNFSTTYEAMVIDNDNGFVGIGGAPAEQLHIQSAGSVTVRIEADTDNLTETDVPTLNFSHGGGAVQGNIGINASHAFYIDADYAEGPGILFSIDGVAVGQFKRSPQQLESEGPVKVKSYAVAGMPSASLAGAGAIIYLSDAPGGATLAFSDGSNWRQATDRAVVS